MFVSCSLCFFYTRPACVWLSNPDQVLVELLHLLQGTAHGCGVVRAKLVTRRVWFLPVQSCKHHALLLVEPGCQRESTQMTKHSVADHLPRAFTSSLPRNHLIKLPSRS